MISKPETALSTTLQIQHDNEIYNILKPLYRGSQNYINCHIANIEGQHNQILSELRKTYTIPGTVDTRLRLLIETKANTIYGKEKLREEQKVYPISKERKIEAQYAAIKLNEYEIRKKKLINHPERILNGLETKLEVDAYLTEKTTKTYKLCKKDKAHWLNFIQKVIVKWKFKEKPK
jgi:hypothetical protein